MHNAPKCNLIDNSCSKRIGWFMRNNISHVLVLVMVPKAAFFSFNERPRILILLIPDTRANHNYQPPHGAPPTLRTPKFYRFLQTFRETLKIICTIKIGRNITNIVLFLEVVVLRPPNRTFGDTRSIDLAWRRGRVQRTWFLRNYVWQGSLNNRSLLALRLRAQSH
jgi:hypothetical protein